MPENPNYANEPVETRWRWYFPIPAWAADTPPGRLVDYLAASLQQAGVTLDGRQPDISIGDRGGVPTIFINADRDPVQALRLLTVAPPAPPTGPGQADTATLTSFLDNVQQGNTPTPQQITDATIALAKLMKWFVSPH